jgi:hypothetical protein
MSFAVREEAEQFAEAISATEGATAEVVTITVETPANEE